jgi:hypothetical protein
MSWARVISDQRSLWRKIGKVKSKKIRSQNAKPTQSGQRDANFARVLETLTCATRNQRILKHLSEVKPK